MNFSQWPAMVVTAVAAWFASLSCDNEFTGRSFAPTEQDRVNALEREVKELRRANELTGRIQLAGGAGR